MKRWKTILLLSLAFILQSACSSGSHIRAGTPTAKRKPVNFKECMRPFENKSSKTRVLFGITCYLDHKKSTQARR